MNEFLLTKLKTQYKEIDDLLVVLSSKQVLKRPNTDKWSILENMAHLARYQEVFLQRMLRILSQENPKLERYKAENDASFASWQNLSQAEVIKKLERSRLDLIDFFENLPTSEWDRIGTHPVLGALSIQDWLRFFLLHESHHLYTIFKIRHSY